MTRHLFKIFELLRLRCRKLNIDFWRPMMNDAWVDAQWSVYGLSCTGNTNCFVSTLLLPILLPAYSVPYWYLLENLVSTSCRSSVSSIGSIGSYSSRLSLSVPSVFRLERSPGIWCLIWDLWAVLESSCSSRNRDLASQPEASGEVIHHTDMSSWARTLKWLNVRYGRSSKTVHTTRRLSSGVGSFWFALVGELEHYPATRQSHFFVLP